MGRKKGSKNKNSRSGSRVQRSNKPARPDFGKAKLGTSKTNYESKGLTKFMKLSPEKMKAQLAYNKRLGKGK